MEFHHVPILLDECMEYLISRPDGIYVDGTLGGGGHSEAILKRISPQGQLIGIDQDPNAISAATERLSVFGSAFTAVHDNFVNIRSVLHRLHMDQIDGMLLDIGVSSHQLDVRERGFSYQEKAPLDMRMNPEQDFSAYHVVNEYSEEDIYRVIRDYGEEKWAKRIAQFIVTERKKEPIRDTERLVGIIKMAIPAKARREGPHPAKRTFQAIRIEVNQELDVLGQAINDAVDALKPGGRLCIISFHSLEDRIVKRLFQSMENPCICPPKAPICTCGKQPKGKVLTRKPLIPSSEEVLNNPRARSAKLRVLAKLPMF